MNAFSTVGSVSSGIFSGSSAELTRFSRRYPAIDGLRYGNTDHVEDHGAMVIKTVELSRRPYWEAVLKGALNRWRWRKISTLPWTFGVDDAQW